MKSRAELPIVGNLRSGLFQSLERRVERRVVSFFIALFSACGIAFADAPRAVPAGTFPDDVRLRPLKDLNGFFPFAPPATKEEWDIRAERVRRQILVSQGLWPMPEKTPLNAVIHGKRDCGEYTVEKVIFESTPGLFVTGNLYRPKGITNRVPGVLFAHGHWADARLAESKPDEVRRSIAEGEERFEEGGKSRFQSMCVQLARMGCIVWQWDMMGASDAQQLSHKLVHGFDKQRPEMNSAVNWGFFSPQAESHLQSVMGLQTLNAVRSMDFLLSLPEVDPERVAITGASGGGTQTMLLAAIDPRVKLSFPAVMVSCSMQGGCTCENASLLRVDTGNVEFAALFAPKPQGMNSANDWTKGMATNGFPELQKLYSLFGASNKVMLKRGEHFPHNYNAVTRSAFFSWLNKHFKLGFPDPVIERDYHFLKREELTVWDDAHPAPKAADPEFERQLCRQLHEASQKQIEGLAKDPGEFRRVCGGALDIVLDRRSDGDVTEWKMTDKTDRGSWLQMTGLIRNETRREELPAVSCYPKKWNGRTVIWLTGEGKSALFAADGSLKPDVQAVVDSGSAVLGLDLLYQGEFTADGRPLSKTARVSNPREAAAYTFGYNSALFVHRVHDIVTAVQFVKSDKHDSKRMDLVGLDGAGPLVAAALKQCTGVNAAALDTAGFRFGNVTDIHSPDFLPGGAKYGDLPGMIALASPARLWIAGESAASLAAVKDATIYNGSAENARAEAVKFLLRDASN